MRANATKKSAAILGIGLDHQDGHTRLTCAENFVLVGGSQETHAQMQETAIKVSERLDRSGRRLQDVSVSELREIFHEVTESQSR